MTKSYTKLKTAIQSCKDMESLNNLRYKTIRHAKDHKKEGDIMVYFIQKEAEFTPNPDDLTIETAHHKRFCGAH